MLTDEQMISHISAMFTATCDYCSKHGIEPRDGLKIAIAASGLLAESIKLVEQEDTTKKDGP